MWDYFMDDASHLEACCLRFIITSLCLEILLRNLTCILKVKGSYFKPEQKSKRKFVKFDKRGFVTDLMITFFQSSNFIEKMLIEKLPCE